MTYKEFKEGERRKEWDWEVPIQFFTSSNLLCDWLDEHCIDVKGKQINTSVFEEAEVVE